MFLNRYTSGSMVTMPALVLTTFKASVCSSTVIDSDHQKWKCSCPNGVPDKIRNDTNRSKIVFGYENICEKCGLNYLQSHHDRNVRRREANDREKLARKEAKQRAQRIEEDATYHRMFSAWSCNKYEAVPFDQLSHLPFNKMKDDTPHEMCYKLHGKEEFRQFRLSNSYPGWEVVGWRRFSKIRKDGSSFGICWLRTTEWLYLEEMNDEQITLAHELFPKNMKRLGQFEYSGLGYIKNPKYTENRVPYIYKHRKGDPLLFFHPADPIRASDFASGSETGNLARADDPQVVHEIETPGGPDEGTLHDATDETPGEGDHDSASKDGEPSFADSPTAAEPEGQGPGQAADENDEVHAHVTPGGTR